MTVAEIATKVAAVWIVVEVSMLTVSKPAYEGEPIRPPLSVGEYLIYNPGLLVDGDQE